MANCEEDCALARMGGKTIISREGSQNWVKTLKLENY